MIFHGAKPLSAQTESEHNWCVPPAESTCVLESCWTQSCWIGDSALCSVWDVESDRSVFFKWLDSKHILLIMSFFSLNMCKCSHANKKTDFFKILIQSLFLYILLFEAVYVFTVPPLVHTNPASNSIRWLSVFTFSVKPIKCSETSVSSLLS